MRLSDEHISQFQMLYKKHFGKDINKEDAYEQGIKLLRLMSLVYQPMSKEQFVKLQQRIEIIKTN
jgi:hypothetical protein